MTKTLELAVSKAKQLPAAAQEAIGRQVLHHIAGLQGFNSALQTKAKRQVSVQNVLRWSHDAKKLRRAGKLSKLA